MGRQDMEDRISLFSISGRCLRDVKGVSRLRLSGIAMEPIIVRVNRGGKVLSTGMVMTH
jgi:hypothetical protein